MIFVIINFTNFDTCLLMRVMCVARMDVNMVLLSCYYLQYAKYIIVCSFVFFCIYIFFLFILTCPIGMCVSTLLDKLSVYVTSYCGHSVCLFPLLYLYWGCVLLSDVKFIQYLEYGVIRINVSVIRL
jgi:hypothetical protein